MTDRVVEERVYEAGRTASVSAGLRELALYKEVVSAFATRGIRVRYKQAALGVGWAVLQPLAFLAIFLVLFRHVVKVSGGGVPYAAFALSALVPWQYVASTVAYSSNSLVSDGHLLRKVYFPREAPVLGAVLSYLPDLTAGLLLIVLASPLTGAHLGWSVLLAPALVVALVIPVVATSLPLSALTVYYRDFRFAVPLMLQLWMFASPVAYPLSRLDSKWHTLYALLNPISGILDAFSQVFAHGAAPHWRVTGLSLASSAVLLAVSYVVFKRIEQGFADRV